MTFQEATPLPMSRGLGLSVLKGLGFRFRV